MNVWLGIVYQVLNIYAATFSSSFKFKISFWDLHTALSQQKWWHICIFSPGWNFRSHKINKMIRSQWVGSITKYHYYYLKNNIRQIRKHEMTLPNSPKCTITTITLTKIYFYIALKSLIFSHEEHIDSTGYNGSIQAYTYMHALAFNEKRNYQREGKWGSAYGVVWRKEMEGRYVIKL